MKRRRYGWPPRSLQARSSWATRGGVLAIAIGLLVAGCSTGSSARASLEERVRAYWELKQSKRWEDVYDGYLSPELKTKLAKDAFLKRRLLAFDILNFTVSETREDGDRATVTVTNEVNIPIRGAGGAVQLVRKTTTTKDDWVRVDGVWYVVLSE